MSPSPAAAPLDERAVVREAHWAEAQAALADGDTGRAIEACRRALEVSEGDPAVLSLYSIALHRAGQTREGAELLTGLVRSNPSFPGGYANLGELQRQSGEFEAAVVSLGRAAELDPENSHIQFNLGRAYRDSGAQEEAAAAYRRALECDYGFVPAHRGLVRVLNDLVEPGEAELENRCLRLAVLLASGGADRDYAFKLGSALQGVRRTVRFGRPDAAGLVVLGKLLVALGEAPLAIAALEKAVGQPGVHADAYVALSMAYAEANRWHEARATTARFARAHPFGSRTGPDATVDVLVLEALYNPAFEKPGDGAGTIRYGHAAYARRGMVSLLPPGRASYHHLYIDEIDPAAPPLPGAYDVIYNNIGFAEINLRRNYGEAIGLIGKATGLEIVNRPDAVDAATRAGNSQALRSLDHAIFPKTLSYQINAARIDASIASIVHEFSFPVLVRTRLHGAARNFHMAGDARELREVFRRIDPNGKEPVYVIQFHESRHASGRSLRYQAAFVDGVLYPGAMDLSEDWLPVRGAREPPGGKDGGEDGAEFAAAERRWLDDPESAIGRENVAALYGANARLGLDILGLDLGIAADGRVIIFEAGANVNVLALRGRVDAAPHLAAAARRIAGAIEDLLIRKSRPRPSGA
jgi:tetratricopeptide (TPR) repeat protein